MGPGRRCAVADSRRLLLEVRQRDRAHVQVDRLGAGARGGVVAGAVTTPPVLCYHRIGGALELGVTRVGRSVFERQMTALARAGWRTLTLAGFANPQPTAHA